MTAPQSHQRSRTDTVATIILFVVAAIAGALSVAYSFVFAMATDACSGHTCDTSALDWAYLVTWGGIGVAAIVAIGGVIVAAARNRVMWVWPTAALVLIIVSVVIGAQLAASVTPHT
jgi:hypothetical protein